MPVRKQEAHRALELLEDYHSKLTKPQDKQLRLAIERVIRIFKSRLFQALLVPCKPPRLLGTYTPEYVPDVPENVCTCPKFLLEEPCAPVLIVCSEFLIP
ncbi:hypothetical protein RN001_004672 [Aquatica leii]|uniref:L27 domain-containing protein n=1 Tax=Aquatica leii TaxID=1421715 RepID=A0AAN7SPL9_9COLE|nr:hypothetical protein RN001_004672 [Aquatica leii]